MNCGLLPDGGECSFGPDSTWSNQRVLGEKWLFAASFAAINKTREGNER